MTNFCKLFGGHKDLEKKFQQFKAHSYTTDYGRRIQGQRVSYAVKKENVVHMDVKLAV